MNSRNIALYVIYSLIIAVAYYVLSYVSKTLILPPTFAAPIWLPAGLGVGVLILWGYRYIPALIIGEIISSLDFYDAELVAENSYLVFTYTTVLLSIVIRSVLAHYFVKTHLGQSNNYLTLQSVTKMLIFAALIPTFISSIIVTYAMHSSQLFYFDSWIVNFLTWWFGDVVGIGVVLPIMFLLFKKPRNLWQPRLIKTLIPVVMTCALIVLATHNIKNLELTRLVNILDTKIDLLSNEITSKFQHRDFANVGLITDEIKDVNTIIYTNEINEFIIQNELNDIHFKVYSDNDSGKNLIYESTNKFSNNQQWKSSKETQFADQTWQILAYATPESYQKYASWLIWWLTAIGFLFVVILIAGLLVITGSQIMIKDTVVKRTNEINTLNAILQKREKRYKQLIEIQPVIFWRHIRGEKTLNYVSNEVTNILGYSKKELLDIEHIWNNLIHPDDRKQTLKKYFKGIASNKSLILKYRALTKKGQYIWLKDYISMRKFDDRVEVIGLKIDITKEQLKKQEIIKLAYFDSMTGLPNRVNFMSSLQSSIKTSLNNNLYGAILYLDLDRFKVLNDSMGHYFGDKLLIQISKRLKNSLKTEDICSRFGGDEFVVMVAQQEKTLEQIKLSSVKVAEKIQTAIKKPFNIDGHNFFTSFSIGLSIFPHNSSDANEIIQQADIAMYTSKEQGKNTINFFKVEMQLLANKRLIIEKSLKIAILRHEFEMFYQPIFDQDKNILKFESLIRWNHPTEGLLYPDSFIQIAEETGLILELSEWIISDVVEQISLWKKNKFNILDVSINLSLFQFMNTQVIELLEATTKKYNIENQHITLELTESIGIGDFEATLVKLKHLNSLGFKIAIDDFGTGYSSLNYLTQMPIDILKLDKSFVANIGKEKNSDSLIETIIIMAKQLELELIIEGVETEEQFDFLKDRGCSIFQGYLVHQPMSTVKIEQVMKS
ncbi:MAG: EAL domain-containing protein [Marinicellaceae bacterium]